MVKPFSPQEAEAAQREQMPDEVLTVVNGFLAQRAGSSRIVIQRKEVVDALAERGITHASIDANHMLDFAPT